MHSLKHTLGVKKICRKWQGIIYLLGGSAFLVGCFLFFPFFDQYFNTAQVSAWLFIVGSAAFLYLGVTDCFQSTFQLRGSLCQNTILLISVSGSALFLSGSICFLPELDSLQAAGLQFIIGCSLIIVSQTWKIWKIISKEAMTWKECISQNYIAFFMELMSDLGALMFLIGTFILEVSEDDPVLLTVSAAIYTIGGLLFLGYTVLIQKNYFSDPKEDPKDIDYSLVSTLI